MMTKAAKMFADMAIAPWNTLAPWQGAKRCLCPINGGILCSLCYQTGEDFRIAEREVLAWIRDQKHSK